jgi:hypothetical protein
MLEQDGKPALLRPRFCDDARKRQSHEKRDHTRTMSVHLLLAGTSSDPVSDVRNQHRHRT